MYDFEKLMSDASVLEKMMDELVSLDTKVGSLTEDAARHAYRHLFEAKSALIALHRIDEAA